MRGLDNLTKQQIEASRLQGQLSSTKRVETASDDPIAAARIELMNQRIMFGERLQKNREAAVDALELEEGVLTNVETVLQRVRELQVQAGNGTLSEHDRLALADEMSTLLNQLQGLANSQDNTGSYLFSGSRSSAQTITQDLKGNYIYNGDQTVRNQIVSSGLSLAINDTGANVFMAIHNGNGKFSVKEPTIPNSGSAVASSGNVVDTGAYKPDHYSLKVVLNSQQQLVVMVTGQSAGHVIPPSGHVDDAPLYKPGEAITFNGMQVTISGDPHAGDGFEIRPSVNESVFSTINQMITNLKKPFLTGNDKAHVQTINNQLLEQIDGSLRRVLDVRASVGGRLNQLDIADGANQDLIDISEKTKSGLQDADLNEVAANLELQIVYYEIAQKSFVKLQGLSAFNFM